MNKVSLVKYKIIVHESVLAWTHGCGSEITEYFFPELELAINQYSAHLCDKTRYLEPEAKIEKEEEITAQTTIKELLQIKEDLLTQEQLKNTIALAQAKLYATGIPLGRA